MSRRTRAFPTSTSTRAPAQYDATDRHHVHVADGFTDRGIGYHSKFIRKSKKAECLGLVDARIPELRANADGIFKIGRKLGIGTSVVQRVSSSVELEVQNPDEFRKEFSAV